MGVGGWITLRPKNVEGLQKGHETSGRWREGGRERKREREETGEHMKECISEGGEIDWDGEMREWIKERKKRWR